MNNVEIFIISVISSISTASFVAVLVYFFRSWFIERLKASIKHEYDVKLESLKSEVSRREKAALIAELVAEWTHTIENTKRLNQLLWELSLYLPSGLVKDLNNTLSKRSDHKPINQVLVDVRHYLLEGKDPIEKDDIQHFYHSGNPAMNSPLSKK